MGCMARYRVHGVRAAVGGILPSVGPLAHSADKMAGDRYAKYPRAAFNAAGDSADQSALASMNQVSRRASRKIRRPAAMINRVENVSEDRLGTGAYSRVDSVAWCMPRTLSQSLRDTGTSLGRSSTHAVWPNGRDSPGHAVRRRLARIGRDHGGAARCAPWPMYRACSTRANRRRSAHGRTR